MVNGNYVLYGDRPSSGSEIVEDHVQTRTADRKSKRKMNRSANELQHSLNLAQVDNETDSIKYEKKVKEPRLLRYIPTSNVEENFITDKFETYDPLASEERPRRYPFTKKPKNPSDGSLYFSRSNSSSPSGNLPTIAEHNEPFGTNRVQGLPKRNDLPAFESKLDKYFVKPRESTKYDTKASYNGSHPDSLYRVPTNDGVGAGKLMRLMRTLRWPAALVVVCTALAVFVYFLMPDNVDTDANMSNSTYWEASGLGGTQHVLAAGMQKPIGIKKPETSLPNSSGRPKTKTKPPEVDFYDPANDKNFDLISIIDTISGKNKKLPVAPVFPVQVKPEVQYGNEKSDTGKTRVSKILDDENQISNGVTTPKPHITQKPEKPFAVYLENPIETNPKHKLSETIKKAESSNDFNMYGKPKIGDSIEHYRPAQDLAKERPIDISPELQEYYGRIPAKNVDVSFTSGHSKIFGIGIEDAEKMKATTQSSAYNTRVSPTLPPWRDGDDSTTKNYPVNTNADVQECRSPSLAMCRGVLPYDLAGPAPTINGKSVTALRTQFQYLVTTNCSDRAAQFVCSLLEPECSPSPQPPKTPCYSLCKAVLDNCEQYIDSEIAPAFRCKQYENTNCISARAPCSPREFACGDGACVPREWICDGTKDCLAGEDEKHCTECEKTQFRCPAGSCISKRWLCDGYLDCPEGEDETEEQCGSAGTAEPDEEAAGSAPAPSVRRPGRPHAAKYRSQVADDSSKELLITSDSGNGLKRNYTRRPALARLTPYRPKQRKTENSDGEGKSDTRALRKFTPKSGTTKPQQGKESPEESDIGFLEEFDKAIKESKNDEYVRKVPKVGANREHKIDVQGLEKQIEEKPIIEIGKDSNKFERVLNGAQLLKKAAEEEAERARLMNQTTNDEYSFYTNKQPDPAGLAGSTSPCPSGELRCVDGRCITLAQLCDGTIDCSDHADEDNCFT